MELNLQNITKDQHFVPVCYLRNFCADSEQVNRKRNPRAWRYDKLSKCAEFKGVKSMCYSPKLYSINSKSESVINDSIKDKETFFESHYLHDIEQTYSPILKNIIACVKQRKFGGEQKEQLSKFIAIQYLRDPIIKCLCESNEEIPYFRLTEEYLQLVQSKPEILDDPSMKHFMYAYGNKDVIHTLARSLAYSEWTFHYSQNDAFYTSDNPVCLAQDRPNAQNGEGSSDKGKLHIVFPVSKNILLQITQGLQINEIICIDNTPQWQIDSFNFIQAHFAKKYIISATNSFSTIEDKMNNNPFSWDIDKMNLY